MSKLNPFIKMVVDVTSSDYESYEDVLKEIVIWANEENLPHSKEIIVEALQKAINMRYIESFRYSELQQEFEVSVTGNKTLNNLYFLATDEGKKILS